MILYRRRLLFCLVITILAISGYLFFGAHRVSAQVNQQQVQSQEAQWQAELDATNAEIAKWQAILDTTKAGTASLQNDAAALQAKINQAKAFIKQRQVQIEQLTKDIGTKTQTISDLDAKINRGKESLASILRSTGMVDAFSLPEIVLSNQNISEFFQNVDSYSTINESLEAQFKQIRDTQDIAKTQRQALDDQRTIQADTQAKIEADKKKVELDEAEKQKLITINKTQEQTYEQVIADRQKKAAQIRAALFSLRDTEGIAFGDALKYATEAGAETGVRPAFLLAILTQESNLGKNQGSCLINNIDNGDGVGKNTGTAFEQVMKAPRDTVPFKAITDRLNRDWKMTPVSCPPDYKWTSNRGYGGGMGPSQFIPSTWELFKARIATAVGGIDPDSADPWNPEHAIMATAIYVADLGANSQSYTAERNAACKYYSGSSCSSTRKPPNSSYGDGVMAKADNIQTTMIDPLQGY